MENSRNKQFRTFNLCVILSSGMTSHAIPLHPACDLNHHLSRVSTLTRPMAIRHVGAVQVTRLTMDVAKRLCSNNSYVTQYCNSPKVQEYCCWQFGEATEKPKTVRVSRKKHSVHKFAATMVPRTHRGSWNGAHVDKGRASSSFKCYLKENFLLHVRHFRLHFIGNKKAMVFYIVIFFPSCCQKYQPSVISFQNFMITAPGNTLMCSSPDTFA